MEKKERQKEIRSVVLEVLAGLLGALLGGLIALAALYGLGSAGLSGADISSALAAAGGIVGGGMAAGVFVLAVPPVLLSAGGVGYTAGRMHRKAEEEMKRRYQENEAGYEALVEELRRELNALKMKRSTPQAGNDLTEESKQPLCPDPDGDQLKGMTAD